MEGADITVNIRNPLLKDYFVIMNDSGGEIIFDCLNVPLYHSEQLFGVLYVTRKTVSATVSSFSENERNVLNSIGTSLSYFTRVFLDLETDLVAAGDSALLFYVRSRR